MSVQAEPPAVRQALEWLFQVCQQSSELSDLHLEAGGMGTDRIMDAIPDWVRPVLPRNDADPFMVEGPHGETATVGRFYGLLFCAWINKKQTVVRLACEMGDEEHPQSTLLSIISLVLFPVLRDVFLRRQGILLHAAAIKCPNNKGVLLIAESCGGKTTTSLSLVRLGAKLVSDDLVVMTFSDDKGTAHGLPKPLNIRLPTVEYFEELRQFALPANPLTGKSSANPQSIYGAACLETSCAINVLYFLNLSITGPSLRRIGVGEALEKLLASHAFCVRQPTGAESVIGLCNLLSLVPAYQLDTGANPGHLGEWLLENCQMHAQS
jgi:hypothetical protein